MQAITNWLFQNGFELISALGIVASLLFTALSFRESTQSRKLENLLEFTTRHQAIWSEWERRPELRRVLDKAPDLKTTPINSAESQFVVRLILHLHSWYHASKDGEVSDFRGVQSDIAGFFELPIPAIIWEEKQVFYDAGFVDYVEAAKDRTLPPV